jgi:hypothetical protein
MMLRPCQGVENMPGTPGAYHLRNTFLAGWAINAARRARKTVAIGSAPISTWALRKLAAGFGANALQVRSRVFAEINVTGKGRSAQANDAKNCGNDDEVSHARLPGPTPPPDDF